MDWYEALEPDPDDEYYDQMCSAAYATMFNKGRDYSAYSIQECSVSAISNLSGD